MRKIVLAGMLLLTFGLWGSSYQENRGVFEDGTLRFELAFIQVFNFIDGEGVVFNWEEWSLSAGENIGFYEASFLVNGRVIPLDGPREEDGFFAATGVQRTEEDSLGMVSDLALVVSGWDSSAKKSFFRIYKLQVEFDFNEDDPLILEPNESFRLVEVL